MSTRFERFAQMAKEEFGLTVFRTSSSERVTFESLFGVSVEDIAQYELPHNHIPVEQFGYYDSDLCSHNPLATGTQINVFLPNDIIAFAA